MASRPYPLNPAGGEPPTRTHRISNPPYELSIQHRRESDRALSLFLVEMADSFTSETVTVRALLASIGERGMLVIAACLIVPFLIPISVPGISTVFGLIVILIGFGAATDRVPWLPARLLDRQIQTAPLSLTFVRGARLVMKIEKFLHPRLNFLIRGSAMNRINGAMLVAGGFLLTMPFGFVPFSNTLPGLAILFLALGMLEHDGAFVLLGYITVAATAIYFVALIGAMIAGGAAALSVWSIPRDGY